MKSRIEFNKSVVGESIRTTKTIKKEKIYKFKKIRLVEVVEEETIVLECGHEILKSRFPSKHVPKNYTWCEKCYDPDGSKWKKRMDEFDKIWKGRI